MKYVPSLDKNFKPMIVLLREFNEGVKNSESQPLTICLERNQGYNYIYNIDVYKDNSGHDEENHFVIERIIKSLLWVVGGFKIYLGGHELVVKKMQEVFSLEGTRAFDVEFMSRVYGEKFEVVLKYIKEQ